MRTTGLLLIGSLLILLVIPGVVGANLTADSFRGSNFSLYATRCPANDMVVRDLHGRVISIAGLRGKVVILNFWKIDCPPCAMEKPILERIYRQYGPRGLAVLSVNLFDDYSRMASYIQSKGLTFTVAYDPEKQFSVRSHTLASGHSTHFVVNPKSEAIYEIAGVPTTYVIDRNGMIVGHCAGMINWEQPPFTQLLDSLLGPRPQIFAQRNAGGGTTVEQSQLTGPSTGSGWTNPEQGHAGTESKPTRFASNGKRWRRVVGSQGVEKASTTEAASTSPPGLTAPTSNNATGNVSPTRARQPQQAPKRSMPRVVMNPGAIPSSTSATQAPAVRRPSTRSATPLPRAQLYNTQTRGAYRQPIGQPPTATAQNFQRSSTTTSRQVANPSNLVSMPRPTSLPPAAPYSRPTFASTPYRQTRNKKAPPQQYIPAAKDGYVVAKVPGARAASGGRPTAVVQPVSHPNAVGNFLLESFPGGAPPSQPYPIQYQQPRPAPSFFQRIGNWGSGIRNAFGNIVPAQ